MGNAKSELDYKNHFELLIAVILSAQSTDKTVNTVTKKLFLNAPTPEDFLLLGQSKKQSKIKQDVRSNTKSKNKIKH